MAEPAYTVSSTMTHVEPKGSGEIKIEYEFCMGK